MAVAEVAISVGFAIAVFLLESNRTGELVADRAQRSMAFLNAQTQHLLDQPGLLDDGEFEIMKQHVQHGLDIVERSEWLADAAGIVGFHHEKFDGSGYHENRRGEDIPLNARIFAIADVFDALTSERPYKKPFEFDKAMQILAERSGSHFDPDLIAAFGGIAESLYREYANRDDDKPRRDLASPVDEYFGNGAELIA